MDESATAAPAEPVEPTAVEGPKSEPRESKVPDEAYVKSLRKEAAENRKAREAAEARAAELEDRDRSDLEKAQRKIAETTKRAAEAEERAQAAEAHFIRQEVAVSRDFKASALPLLHGTTREEIEASADALIAWAKDNEKLPLGFDGGVRVTPADPKTPEEAHNDFLIGILGRNP